MDRLKEAIKKAEKKLTDREVLIIDPFTLQGPGNGKKAMAFLKKNNIGFEFKKNNLGSWLNIFVRKDTPEATKLMKTLVKNSIYFTDLTDYATGLNGLGQFTSLPWKSKTS